MRNVYNGNIVTDGSRTAIVAEEMANNRFTIRSDKPNVKVSWQVTGIRKDPFAEAHRIRVEEEKPAGERGRCEHDEACSTRQ